MFSEPEFWPDLSKKKHRLVNKRQQMSFIPNRFKIPVGIKLNLFIKSGYLPPLTGHGLVSTQC